VHDTPHSKLILQWLKQDQPNKIKKAMKHCFANATNSSSQEDSLQYTESLEIGSGQPSFSSWPFCKEAEAADACFQAVSSSVYSAASTIASAACTTESSLSFPSSSKTNFDLLRILALSFIGGQEHADGRNQYFDSGRGWQRFADIRTERRNRLDFDEKSQAKQARHPESIEQRHSTLESESKLPYSTTTTAGCCQPVLEEYSLGSGNPYASVKSLLSHRTNEPNL
jgi:hypothetical protein